MKGILNLLLLLHAEFVTNRKTDIDYLRYIASLSQIVEDHVWNKNITFDVKQIPFFWKVCCKKEIVWKRSLKLRLKNTNSRTFTSVVVYPIIFFYNSEIYYDV